MLPMQTHTIRDVRLAGGGVLAEARIAYLTAGRLAPDGRNAVLVTHGYTSGPRMIEGGESASEGSWAGLVGPGRPIDTERYFVVASNMLGSSFGSTNAASIDPATGRPYGSRFPELTVGDGAGCPVSPSVTLLPVAWVCGSKGQCPVGAALVSVATIWPPGPWF